MKPARGVLGVLVVIVLLALTWHWQASKVVRQAVAASVARVSAENIHRDPPASLPPALVLNMSGVTFTCRLGHGAYTCTPVRYPVRGPR